VANVFGIDLVERSPMSQTILKTFAGVAALAAIAFGASAIASGSGSRSNTASGAPAGMPGAFGRGGPPGFGTPVTGAAAEKVKAAALARYPGTVERIMKRPDGGYVAHVFRSGGREVHVLVNSNFQVTGVDTGPPGGGMPGGPPPAGATPGRPGTSS
jgi:hypothetical protein